MHQSEVIRELAAGSVRRAFQNGIPLQEIREALLITDADMHFKDVWNHAIYQALGELEFQLALKAHRSQQAPAPGGMK